MGGKRVTHSEEWWATAPSHVLRCTAHYKGNGLLCRREAALGSTVCNSHGALAPAVQAAAANRIQMSVDDAVKRLQSMLDDPAVESRDKVKILHDLLDRGGLGPTSKHFVGLAAASPIDTLFQSILRDPSGLEPVNRVEVAQVVDPYTAQTAREAAEDDSYGLAPLALETGTSHAGEVVDAELVDDAPPPHTIHVTANMSSRPPPWIARQLAEVL